MITSKTVEALSLYQSLNEQVYEENFAEDEALPGEERVKKTFFRRIRDYVTSKDLLLTLFYLSTLGIVTCLVSTLYTLIESAIVHLHKLAAGNNGDPYFMNSEQGNERWLHYFLYVLHCVGFATLAALCPVVFTRYGAGSGIPELKAILSGISIQRYLSFRTAITKFFGLVFGAGAGLFTGREGPFVCLGGCIANLLCKLPLFRAKFLRNPTQHRSMLAAGAAVGIVSTFGTAVGGVIFSIEVTASFFLVSDIWKSFFATVICSILFQFVRFGLKTNGVDETKFEPVPWDWTLFLVIGIGIFAGMAGALFNTLVRKFGYFVHHTRFFHHHPVCTVAIVACISGLISWPWGLFITNEWDDTMNDMFTNGPIDNPAWLEMFGGGKWSIIPALLVMFLVRIIITPMTIACSIPTGIFVPSLTMGAILGRIYGEFLTLTGLSPTIPPGIYALVGSAGMCTGVTHSIAVAVIVLELTGQMYHVLHVLLGTLVALSVSSSICPSYYDNAIVSHNIPYLPFMVDPRSKETARDIMNRDVQIVSMSATLKELKYVYRRNPDFIAFPLVDSKEAMTLIGSIRRKDLQAILEEAGGLPGKMSRTTSWHNFANKMKQLKHRISRSQSSIDVPAEKIARAGLLKHIPNADSSSSIASTLATASPAPSPSPSPVPPELVHPVPIPLPKHEPVNGPESLATVPPSLNANIVYQDDDEDIERSEGIAFCLRSCEPSTTTLSKVPNLQYDQAPLQIPEQTSRSRVHLFFTMLACSYIYVTIQGRLTGIITKRYLIQNAVR